MGDRNKARDEEFQSFVVGRWPRLMRTAFLLTGEQHAAEDLVQSTLEQVYVAWVRAGDMVIRPVAGSSANWFVCLAPAGTAYKSVEVTK